VTSYEEFEPEEPRGWNPFAVASIATLVLLLGLGGALFGISVADKNKKAAAGTLPDSVATIPVEPPPTTTPPASPSPSPTASPTPSPSPSASPDRFVLPGLADLDFQVARTRVRDLKLGWSLVFEGPGTDATVRTTDPTPGSTVKRGDTIKIYVRGTAPLAMVPAVTGLTCDHAADLIVDAGLYPTYTTGRTGTVLSQSTQATDLSTLRWNDHLSITCG